MVFQVIEIPVGYDSEFHLHLCHMDLDDLKGEGIGLHGYRFTLSIRETMSGGESMREPSHGSGSDGGRLLNPLS